MGTCTLCDLPTPETPVTDAEIDGEEVVRVGTGIWRNEETGEMVTGGAYKPQTPGGQQATRSIRAARAEEEE